MEEVAQSLDDCTAYSDLVSWSAKNFLRLDPKDVKLVEKLPNQGGCSIVWSGLWRGQCVAIKSVDVHGRWGVDSISLLKRELAVMQISNFCDHVCRYLGFICDEKEYCIIMRLYKGSLRQHLKSHGGKLPPAQALSVAIGIAKGLCELHRLNVVHADLKPDNVLLNELGDVVLTDFGISRVVEVNGQSILTQTCQGTPNYMAPEQLGADDGMSHITFKADIWAFACTVIHILEGKPPMEGMNMFQIIRRVTIDVRCPEPPSCLSLQAPAFHSLLLDCLASSPAERPSSLDLLSRLREIQVQQYQSSSDLVSELSRQLADREETISQLGSQLQASKSQDAQLLQACLRGDVDDVHALIEGHAALDARDEEFRTPIHVAAEHGHQDVLSALLEANASVCVEDRRGRSALEAACEAGYTFIVRCLIDAGALDGSVDCGPRSLVVACSHGHVDVAVILLKAGVPADSGYEGGGTALHSAATQAQASTVQLLIKEGANLDAVDAFGWTPLHWACHMGHVDVALALIFAGARKDMLGQDGTSPLAALMARWGAAEGDIRDVQKLNELKDALS